MARAEQEKLAYLFRLRMTANVRRAMQRAMRESEWTDAGQGWQGKETSLRLIGWSRHLLRVSRPAGFHRQPLSERCVNLSAHTAPIRQTCWSSRGASV
jgi:hypothetical protein